MKDTFSNMHPLVSFVFFAAVILLSMFLMHPVCLCISIICALLNAVYLNGKKAVFFTLKFLLPTSLFIIVINPLSNHRGVTLIDYLPWGNPLTLESVLYGFASAVLISSVALWFMSMNRVITSDKLVYLFGRIAPSLSLLLAMALRFIPRFTERLRQVRSAQKQITRSGKNTLLSRFKAGIRVLSIMISWSMESSVDTSDSMKSRGYGLKGRTAFSLYRFHRFDAVVLSGICIAVSYILILLFSKRIKFSYYPALKGNTTDIFSVLFYIVYALLMLTPMIINVGEGIKWKLLRSKI